MTNLSSEVARDIEYLLPRRQMERSVDKVQATLRDLKSSIKWRDAGFMLAHRHGAGVTDHAKPKAWHT